MFPTKHFLKCHCSEVVKSSKGLQSMTYGAIWRVKRHFHELKINWGCQSLAMMSGSPWHLLIASASLQMIISDKFIKGKVFKRFIIIIQLSYEKGNTCCWFLSLHRFLSSFKLTTFMASMNLSYTWIIVIFDCKCYTWINYIFVPPMKLNIELLLLTWFIIQAPAYRDVKVTQTQIIFTFNIKMSTKSFSCALY